MRYADAGVNIAVADDSKNRIRHLATRTFTNGVLGGIGSFGALFELDKQKFKEPILVSSADGVGTKLKDCATDLVGILYQNSSGTIDSVVARNQELDLQTLFGCQDGLGLWVQSSGAGSPLSRVSTPNLKKCETSASTERCSDG